MRSPVSFHRRLGLYVDRWWMTSTIDKALPPTPRTEISLEIALTMKTMQTPLLLSRLCFRCSCDAVSLSVTIPGENLGG